MPVENNSPGRAYPLPDASNALSDDVLRLINAILAIDDDVADILLALAGKAALAHGHVMADVSGLTAALAGKSDTSHNHTLASLNGVSISGPASGQVLIFASGVWSNGTITIASITNLQATLNSLQAQIDTIDGGTF